MPLALPALGSEVPHEVFIRIAKKIITVGAILREIEGGTFEDGYEIGETLHHLFATAELIRIVEVRHVGQLVRPSERSENFFIDLVANVGLAFQGDHVGKAGALRNGDRRVRLASVSIADVFHEKEDEHVVLVLARIHAAAQFVAARPER